MRDIRLAALKSIRGVLAMVAVLLLVAPAGARIIAEEIDPGHVRPPAAVVKFRRASIGSLRVASEQLLADRGYAVEYLFELLDEEEVRVRATRRQEMISGRVRTILDGRPVEAEIQLRGEPMPLVVDQDDNRLVAAWKGEGRLIPSELASSEIERRLTLLLDLLGETKRRLGLSQFSPSQDSKIRLRLAAVDTIALIPALDILESYEIWRPTTADAAEVLIKEVAGRQWKIRWRHDEMKIQLRPGPASAQTTVVYRAGQATGYVENSFPIRPAEATQIAATAFFYLQAAREYFGIASVKRSLPIR